CTVKRVTITIWLLLSERELNSVHHKWSCTCNKHTSIRGVLWRFCCYCQECPCHTIAIGVVTWNHANNGFCLIVEKDGQMSIHFLIRKNLRLSRICFSWSHVKVKLISSLVRCFFNAIACIADVTRILDTESTAPPVIRNLKGWIDNTIILSVRWSDGKSVLLEHTICRNAGLDRHP